MTDPAFDIPYCRVRSTPSASLFLSRELVFIDPNLAASAWTHRDSAVIQMSAILTRLPIFWYSELNIARLRQAVHLLPNRILRILLSTWPVVIVGGCASLGPLSPLKPLETSLIYQPAEWPNDFEVPQAAAVEDAWFHATDGTKLHGLFAEHPDPQAVALVCHGNAGNVADRLGSLSILHGAHRLSVLMFDYRGYGKSEGSPDEKGILSDARAARKWLAKRTGVSESEIVIMGRSLGGAVAVDLASQDGAKALVIASTFPSLPKVAKHHLKLLPANLLMTQRLDSLSKIQHFSGPLLQSHAIDDELIPISLGRQLFEAAPGHKRFVEVTGGHNAPQSPEYRHALEELLKSL